MAKIVQFARGNKNLYNILTAEEKQRKIFFAQDTNEIIVNNVVYGINLKSEDLEFITRRLMILAYEDVGFGNPSVGPRVYAACQTALAVGLPEARIPLSFAAIDLASSPKSNSAYLAINDAISDLDNLTSMQIPPHILNKEIKGGAEYKYPHDYPNGYVNQQYMPDALLNKKYYKPKSTGAYERALKDFLEKIKE